MGTKEAYARGVIAEKLIQSKLWKYGYSVQKATVQNVIKRKKYTDSGLTIPYDFLVDNRIRLEVKSSKLYPAKKHAGRWEFQIDTNDADVFAFVFWYPDGYSVVRYITYKNLCSLLKKQGRKKNAENFSFKNPNDENLERSPYTVFGKVIHTRGIDL